MLSFSEMIIIDYQNQKHKSVVEACAGALKQGKVVVYPTDTSYGLAVDAANIKAIKRLYKIKGRIFKKPMHVVVPSLAYARNIVKWNSVASRLAKRFWPGPLTLVLGLRAKRIGLSKLSAGTGFLGVRIPNNKIALDLSRTLKHPITATSANRSGQKDCYSVDEVLRQFSAKGESAFGGKNQKYKPDIIINAGRLPKRKPSTLVKVNGNKIEILRQGSVNEKQIGKVLAFSYGK